MELALFVIKKKTLYQPLPRINTETFRTEPGTKANSRFELATYVINVVQLNIYLNQLKQRGIFEFEECRATSSVSIPPKTLPIGTNGGVKNSRVSCCFEGTAEGRAEGGGGRRVWRHAMRRKERHEDNENEADRSES